MNAISSSFQYNSGTNSTSQQESIVTTQFLKTMGQRIKSLILEKGYNSAYDFWIQNPQLDMSRVTLNSIINGKTDVRILNLYKIAKALETDLSVLVEEKVEA